MLKLYDSVKIKNQSHKHDRIILRDPWADSGGEGKSRWAENMAQRKVKNSEKSPWRQCLTRPVPNGRRHSAF